MSGHKNRFNIIKVGSFKLQNAPVAQNVLDTDFLFITLPNLYPQTNCLCMLIAHRPPCKTACACLLHIGPHLSLALTRHPTSVCNHSLGPYLSLALTRHPKSVCNHSLGPHLSLALTTDQTPHKCL